MTRNLICWSASTVARHRCKTLLHFTNLQQYAIRHRRIDVAMCNNVATPVCVLQTLYHIKGAAHTCSRQSINKIKIKKMQKNENISLGKYLEMLVRKYPEETLALIKYNLEVEKINDKKILKNKIKCKICDNYGERIKCNKCDTNHPLCNNCFTKITKMHDFYFKKIKKDINR